MLRRTSLITAMALLLIASAAVAQDRPRGPGRGGPGGFGFGGPGGGQGFSLMLVGIPEVREELGLSDDQNKKLDELSEEAREQMRASFGNFNPQDFQNLSEEERQKRMDESRKKMEESNKKTEEKLAKVLEPKQADRLNQLRLQREGVGALNRAEVAMQIGLTQEQQEKIGKIQEESRPQRGGGGNFQDMSEDERNEFFAKMRERQEKAQTDIVAILTDDQKSKWDEMKGKEFKFPQPRFGGGFGPGGGRGPGPGGPGQGGDGERRRPERKQEN